jgi:hypothetical protein
MPVSWGSGSFQARAPRRAWPAIHPTDREAQPLPARDSLSVRSAPGETQRVSSLNTSTAPSSMGRFKLFRFSSSRYGTRALPATPTYKHKHPFRPRLPQPGVALCEICKLSLDDLSSGARCFRHSLDRPPMPKVMLSMQSNDELPPPCQSKL